MFTRLGLFFWTVIAVIFFIFKRKQPELPTLSGQFPAVKNVWLADQA